MKIEPNDGVSTNGHAHQPRNGSRPANGARAAVRFRRLPEPAELLPLTEPVYHILLSLADRELHGYGIILSVEEATSGKVRLRTGTLYTAVRRLADDGLIEESADSPDDDRRRYYKLTAFGRSVARAESRRVASLTSLAREKGLLARGARPRF